MKSNTNIQTLTPRQSTYLQAYSSADSPTFGNAYKSAISAGYSIQTARNFNHLKPEWLSENIGKLATMQPDELMRELTAIIQSNTEPTIIRLKAIEMTMRAYSMLVQHKELEQRSLTLSIDLTGTVSVP